MAWPKRLLLYPGVLLLMVLLVDLLYEMTLPLRTLTVTAVVVLLLLYLTSPAAIARLESWLAEKEGG